MLKFTADRSWPVTSGAAASGTAMAPSVAFVESRSKSEQAKPWDLVGSLVDSSHPKKSLGSTSRTNSLDLRTQRYRRVNWRGRTCQTQITQIYHPFAEELTSQCCICSPICPPGWNQQLFLSGCKSWHAAQSISRKTNKCGKHRCVK